MNGEEAIQHAGRQFDRPIESETQINEMILKAAGSTKKAYIDTPKFKVAEVAVLVKDGEGKFVLTDNKTPLYEIKKVNIFDGWVHQEVDLPIPEFFDEDLVMGNLGPREMELLNRIHSTIAFLMVRMIREEKNFSGTINQLCWIAHSIALTTQAKAGNAVMMAKTTMSKAETKSYSTEQLLKQEKKKQGMLERVFRRN
jgi:hypothetical protein